MVHRSADSRLLSNLLQNEKEYSKHLTHLQDYSNHSLASFAAYAAASPQPTSQVILSVAGSLAAADEALRRYVMGVDEWRDAMRGLKEMEEEVGNIMRDREILSQKSGAGNIRESLLLGHQKLSSASSLSLTSTPPDSPSPGASRPLSASFSLSIPSSTKLAAAQAELHACETHLAAKEHELAVRRCTALKEGLGARMRAMAECGWAWSEIGKEATRTLEEMGVPVRGDVGGGGGGGGLGGGYDVHSSDSRTSSPLVRQVLQAPAVPSLSPSSHPQHITHPTIQHVQVHPTVQHVQVHPYPPVAEVVSGLPSSSTTRVLNYPSVPEIMESPLAMVGALAASQVQMDRNEVYQQHQHQQQQEQHRRQEEHPQEEEDQHQQQQYQQPPPPVSILSLVDPTTAFGSRHTPAPTSLPLGQEVDTLNAQADTLNVPERDQVDTLSVPDRDEVDEPSDRELELEQEVTPIDMELDMDETVRTSATNSTIIPTAGVPATTTGIPLPTTTAVVGDTAIPATITTTHTQPTNPPPTSPTQTSDDRPASNSSSATGASSLYYTPVTPTTYKTETISYAPAIAVHVGPVGGEGGMPISGVGTGTSAVATGTGTGTGGIGSGTGMTSGVGTGTGTDVAPSALPRPISMHNSIFGDEVVVSPYAPLSRKEYFEEDLHKSVRIPPAHAIGEYEMPVATTSDGATPPLSGGVGSGGGGGGSMYAPPISTTTTRVDGSPVKRNSLLMRLGSLAGGGGGSGRSSSPSTPVSQGEGYARHVLERRITEEGVGVGGKGKGKEVVNEREDDESSEESEERWGKEKELKVVENPRFMSEERKRELKREEMKLKEKEKGKGKQKEAVDGDETKREDSERHVSFVQHRKGTESQSTVDVSKTSPTKQSSPSKGFLSGIRGLFHTRLAAPSGAKKGDHRRTVSEVVPSRDEEEEGDERRRAREDSDDDSSVFERSPVKTSSGFHLFGGKKKGGVKESKWETRTDRNIKKLEGKAGVAFPKSSFDGGGPVVVDAGGAERVLRTASVTRGGSNASVLSDAKNERERKKLRKARDGAMEVTRRESAKTPVKKGLTHRRSASVDVGVQQRKSFVESEARKTNAENEMRRSISGNGNGNGEDRKSFAESEGGTVNGIVDLGSRRRRAASEAAKSGIPRPSEEGHSSKVPMAYVPTAPGSVIPAAGLHLGEETPRPVHTRPFVRPEPMDTTPIQRKSSLAKTRKPSLDVGHAAPPLPPPVQSQTSVSPPLSRRPSTKAVSQQHVATTKPSPSKPPSSPGKSATPKAVSPSPSKATILPAGGDHPSGTLVAHSGWYAQQSPLTSTTGGAISRNTSVRSNASAPSGSGQGIPQSRGTKRQKQSVLGQGMPTTSGAGAGVGRHASLGHGSGAQAYEQLHQQPHQQQHGQPQSLLKILEDVAKVNKKGWAGQGAPVSGVGGSGGAAGGIGIPSAPPRVLTENLKAMDQDEFRSKVGASPPVQSPSHGAKVKHASTATAEGSGQALWEIKAPGSVWDQRQALIDQGSTPTKPLGMYKEASMSAPDLTRGRSMTSSKPVGGGAGRMPNGHTASGSGTSNVSASPARGQPKMPLRSAMRYPSRTPSPLVSGSSHVRAGSAPGPASSSSYPSPSTRLEPLVSITAPPPIQMSSVVGGGVGYPKPQTQGQGQTQVVKKDKGKARAVDETEDTGAESSAYETGNEAFYTDEEGERGVERERERQKEREAERRREGGMEFKTKKPVLAAPVPYTGPGLNGYAGGGGYTGGGVMKATSDVSRSDTSGHAHATTSASASGGVGEQQPRRRKSVRVSLNPTFSPSPPAIEYDEDEVQGYGQTGGQGQGYGQTERHEKEKEKAKGKGRESSSAWDWEPKPGPSRYESMAVDKAVAEQHSGMGVYNPAIASPKPHAPARQHSIVKQGR
ncbi:hypothetical protein CVT24_008810, partial [Panaeolus cyanescens]